MAEGLHLHLCINQCSTCSNGLLLRGDLALLQVTGWSEVTSLSVRGSPECFAGNPVTMPDAVAASLRRAGQASCCSTCACGRRPQVCVAHSNKTAAARALQARNHGCKNRCDMQIKSSWLHCEDWHDSTSIAALHAGLTRLGQPPSLLLWDLCCCLSFLSTLRQN